MKKEVTIERCQKYLDACKEKGKKSIELEAIEFLLGEINKTRINDSDLVRHLTYESGERWLDRWHDVPTERWPHAVKLLLIYSNSLKWHMSQRELHIGGMRELERDVAALTGLFKLAKDRVLGAKEPK